MIQLEQKTASQIAKEISERIVKRRKELHFTQAELAARAEISFASYKRFEQKHEISFVSLIKIAIALNLENEFDSLFSTAQQSGSLEHWPCIRNVTWPLPIPTNSLKPFFLFRRFLFRLKKSLYS